MRSRALIVAGMLVGTLATGGWLLESTLRGPGTGFGGGAASWPFARSGGIGAQVFAQVVQHVDQDFVDVIPPGQVYQKAIDGMLFELHDPHTAYLTPERVRRLTESTTGMYVGLGIQIDIREGWITIVAALPGSPAEHAGIQTGDRVVEVNGRSTHDWTQDEASAAMHGSPGTTVRIVIERPGVGERLPFTLTREEIHVRAVRHAALVAPDIGYVELTIFSDSTARELRQAIDSLRERGMRTLILDLRNDPGGLLTQGVAVADLFLKPDQTVVTMRGRTPAATRQFVAEVPGPWPALGVIALINGGSASASEIVAGALQDHDRALIVGVPSYGKGSAQTLFRLDSGALKLTTALWYTPSGRSINRRAVRISDDAADDVDSAPPGPAGVTGANGASGAGEVSGAGKPGGSADTTIAKALFRTDARRVVFGGGGITPDVVIRDSAAEAREAELQRVLGNQLPVFRDALTSYALSLKAGHAAGATQVTITPAMRDELYRRMRARGMKMDRRSYDELGPAIDRWLSADITRYTLGADGAYRARLRTDPVFLAALDIATHAENSRDLVLHPVSSELTARGADSGRAVAHVVAPSGSAAAH